MHACLRWRKIFGHSGLHKEQLVWTTQTLWPLIFIQWVSFACLLNKSSNIVFELDFRHFGKQSQIRQYRIIRYRLSTVISNSNNSYSEKLTSLWEGKKAGVVTIFCFDCYSVTVASSIASHLAVNITVINSCSKSDLKRAKESFRRK